MAHKKSEEEGEFLFKKRKTEKRQKERRKFSEGRFSPGSDWICHRVGSSGRTGWQEMGQKAVRLLLSAPPPRLENKHRWTMVRILVSYSV